MRSLRSSAIALLLCGLPLALSQTPATNPPQNAPAPVFRVSTSLVSFDLVATDHSGRAIPDLKPEELRVQEDGKVRPIQHLELQRPAVNTTESTNFAQQVKAILANLPPGMSTNVSSLRSVPAGATSTVILLDALNTQTNGRFAAHQAMLDLIAKTNPDQPVAIYGLASSLHLLQDFTTDLGTLRAVVQKSAPQSGLQGVPEGELIDHTESDLLPPNVPEVTYLRVRRFEFETASFQLDLRVQRTISALQAIALRLQSVPGRKNLIWLSGAFPLQLMRDYAGGGVDPDMRHYDRELSAVAAALADARVSVYPVDASGLMVGGGLTADHNPAGFARYGGAAIDDSIHEFSQENRDTHTTMDEIADQTGGRAYYNHNDLARAMHDAIDDGSTYYALAFTPRNEQPDGKFHQVKITITRKGVELRYRRGYYALNSEVPSKERIRFMQAEMGAALGEQSQVSAGIILYARPATAPGAIDLIVDPRALTLAHAASGAVRVQFQVATASFDQKGKVLDSSTDVVGTDIQPDRLNAFLHRGAHFRTKFKPNPNVKRVRIGVRDLANDRIGTVDVAIH